MPTEVNNCMANVANCVTQTKLGIVLYSLRQFDSVCLVVQNLKPYSGLCLCVCCALVFRIRVVCIRVGLCILFSSYTFVYFAQFAAHIFLKIDWLSLHFPLIG